MDLTIYETGGGGDLVLQGNNLETTNSLFNMPYLGLFGGNVEASTPTARPANEQAFDYWGNALLMPNNIDIQYNSITEKTLNETSLNSAGRIKIEQAVRKDLAFMSDFADITVAVSITGIDKLKILINVQEPTNNQNRDFVYIWDATKGEIIDQQLAGMDFNSTRWLLDTGVWNDNSIWVDTNFWID